MTLPLFIVDELPGAPELGRVSVTGAEGRHAVSVKRMGVGERVLVSDGRGRVAQGEVAAVIGRDELVVSIEQSEEFAEPVPSVTVVQALAKGDRADLAVELMTELGVDQIIPWSASRSIAQWKADKADRGIEKWQITAREAAKQSRRPRIPVIGALESTLQVVERIRTPDSGLVLVLHEDALLSLVESLGRSQGVTAITLIVGPEGGIAPAEVDAFVSAGATPVRLGREVVRTSTAGGAACAVISALMHRW